MSDDFVQLRDVACAIADTVKQADPGVLEVYHFYHPNPMTPFAVVTMELDFLDRHSMDRMEFQKWRVTLGVQVGDLGEAALALLDYVDDAGPKSVRAAFRSADAAWRLVPGISDISYFGFGRMPMSVQSAGWISFGGPEFWGVPLIFDVKYGFTR